MVQNIGGYSRAYGAAYDTESRPRNTSKRTPATGNTAPSPPESEEEAWKRKAALDQAVGAVVGTALHGTELPLDVAGDLLNTHIQSEVIGRVQATISRMRESGMDIDLMQIGESLSTLRDDAINRIKKEDHTSATP